MATSNNKAVFLKKYTARTKEKVGKLVINEKREIFECKHKQINKFGEFTDCIKKEMRKNDILYWMALYLKIVWMGFTNYIDEKPLNISIYVEIIIFIQDDQVKKEDIF